MCRARRYGDAMPLERGRIRSSGPSRPRAKCILRGPPALATHFSSCAARPHDEASSWREARLPWQAAARACFPGFSSRKGSIGANAHEAGRVSRGIRARGNCVKQTRRSRKRVKFGSGCRRSSVFTANDGSQRRCTSASRAGNLADRAEQLLCPSLRVRLAHGDMVALRKGSARWTAGTRMPDTEWLCAHAREALRAVPSSDEPSWVSLGEAGVRQPALRRFVRFFSSCGGRGEV